MSSGLDLAGIRAGYGAVEALHDVTVRFPLGSMVAILGHNGAGKSSLLRVASGTLVPREGNVIWRGRTVTGLAAHQRTNAGITAVPDEPNVFADMTVEENLELIAPQRAHDTVFAVFPTLASRRGQLAGTLSGGERQQLALGCMLLRPGAAVLIDEMGHGLSAAALDRMAGVLTDLADPNRVIVVVEPNQSGLLGQMDFVYVLSRGELAWAGEPGELTRGTLPPGVAQPRQGA